jgi:hypothetical protein
MERKKFVVAFHFKAEFEATGDSEALVLAAASVRHGFERTKSLTLSIVAAIPIAETPPPGTLTEKNQPPPNVAS